MCGIAGIVGRPANQALLKKMADAMIHRGPDDEGYYLSNEVGLAFRRLSILDLHSGHQPMANEDGRVQVVFNGEIYNHLELRKQLINRGHKFATDHSDTECIVHGWEEWGYDLFNKLNGMFAIAIWDETKRALILARDRYGIKPLYFSMLPAGELVFASEIKTLLASGLVENRPNHSGILEYFSFQNLWRQQTMFAGIQQLEAGSLWTWRQGEISKKKFWDITFPRSRKANLSSLVEEHRDLLVQAVRRQIIADVPIMTYLSGGIDSTAITVAAHRDDPTVRAYSCIFNLNNVQDDKVCDEREFSRLVATTYNIDRVELEIQQEALSECLDNYVYALEDLRMGMGYVNFLIAQRVAKDAKVVLSGTGGDEFHAGYIGRFQALGLTETQIPNWFSRLKNFINLKTNKNKDAARKAHYKLILNSIFNTSQYASVFTPEFLRECNDFNSEIIMEEFINQCPSSDWSDRILYVDAKTYLAGLLTFEDKVSMAHSLEARVPLLDNDLIDFVLDIPFEALCKQNCGKLIFRESVKPWVPEKIFNKPKMGFGPPDASWYRGVLRGWIEERLNQNNIKKMGVFNPSYVQSILDDHFSSKANNTYIIWSLLNFQSWTKQFGFFN